MRPVDLPSVAAHQGEPGAPYINTWLLLGPFDNIANDGGLEHAYIAEEEVAPAVGAVQSGRAWTYFDDRLFSRNYDDYNDLFSYFKIKLGRSIAAKTVYAHVWCFSPSDQTVQLRVGADTGFKAWVNGSPVVVSRCAGPESLTTEPAHSYLNSGRDYIVAPARLHLGWNRLLLKVANREAGRFGFYARFTADLGEAVPGLIYSTGGGGGPLRISTRAMPEAGAGDLPVGYREWPYFDTRPDRGELLSLGRGRSGPDGQYPPVIPGIGVGFSFNAALGMQASAFVLTGQGGRAPYSWRKLSGELPPGMALDANGALHGTPTRDARLGRYAFVVQVTDRDGNRARRRLTLNLCERPNRWLEHARMTALIHGPEHLPKDEAAAFAHLMRRQGYGLAMPISYNNGDMLFRWPSAFARKRTDEDCIGTLKAALEKEGIGFGMYMGNLNVPGSPDFSVNQMVVMVEEAMRRYHPKAFWFDWLGLDGTSLDSLFSVIRSYDPNILIILNGSERMSNGDWDVLTFEGWQAWGPRAWRMWPVRFPWPKRSTPETWRLSVEPAFSGSGGVLSDWREMLRIQLSLIGEGFIANMDHTPLLSGSTAKRMADMELMKLHRRMADWASPEHAPALTEAYTNVDPGPLAAAPWGYNTISSTRDRLYLLILKNPRGKTGLPDSASLTIGPIAGRVKSVILMNDNIHLPFIPRESRRKESITIDLKRVKADPVATIIKVVLAAPLPASAALPAAQQQTLAAASSRSAVQVPPGNLASHKPSWLMSADGTRELGPSAGSYAIYGVDGDLATSAQAGYEYAWSYKVDLKGVFTIRRIVAVFHPKCWAAEFRVLVSHDGDTWKSVAYSAQGKPGANSFAIEPQAVRFVRVQAIKPDGPDQPGAQMAISELQVYEH